MVRSTVRRLDRLNPPPGRRRRSRTLTDVSAPDGFHYEVRKSGDVVVFHHGRQATVLRGRRAVDFLGEVDDDPQEVMARVTGNYKRGNERQARNHPRNRGR